MITTNKTSTATLVFFLFLVSYSFTSYSNGLKSSALRTAFLALAGLFLVSICLIVVARTTMVAWITILVLLAFAGKRRRVLANDGWKISTEIAMHLIKVLIKEHQFVTAIFAAVVSVLAMAQITRV